MEEPARPELAGLAVDLDARAAAVDEVELVLLVVVVREALEAGRVDDCVDAEGLDAERRAHLAEARAFAELVDRAECVVHGASLRGGRGCILGSGFHTLAEARVGVVH